MTIAMQGNRIVFAAVVAFTGKRTPDGRVLTAPEGFRCPARAFPLPVFGWQPFTDGIQIAVQAGVIEEAYVVAGRIITFGRLDTAPEFTPFVQQLRDGTHRLEIDLTNVQMEMSGRPVGEGVWEIEGAMSADLHLVSWRLAAAHIGDKPSWDLPPVQIEDLIT